MKKIISLLLAMILCLSFTTPNIASAASIALNKTNLELRAGDTYNLKLTESSGVIKWTSSKRSVATVSSSGEVKAIKEGKATITATNNKKKYKSFVTVKRNETVDVILGAITFDDTSIKDYAEQFKKNNPKYLDVKAFDDDHIIVTMYESDRQKALKEYNDGFNDMLTELVSENSTDGAIVKIEADKLFSKVKIYADKEKCENTFTYLGIYLASAVVADMIQGFNLIDVDDRKSDITVVDIKTGEVLYPTE